MARIIAYRAAEVHSLGAVLADVISRGGIAALPTETYYGLGANPFDAAAVRRLACIKGRPDGKPILVLIGAREQLGMLAAECPAAAAELIDSFWPGPLTIVLPAVPGLPDELTAGSGTVGIRWTACAPTTELLRIAGPVTGTSANRSDAPPVRTAAEVDQMLGPELDVIIEGGITPGGPPSTVVRVGPDVQVVREGAITTVALAQVLAAKGFRLKPAEM